MTQNTLHRLTKGTVVTDSKILIADESGAISYTDEDGNVQNAIVHKGVTRVRSGHPLLKGNEALFKPIDVHFDVRTARAEPKIPGK